MGIYRGPGGSGDAVNDSSSETRLAVEARDAALAAQAAAEAAQAAAETAETNAETAETNAETAETNAETAATNAASSASAASTSASNASSSASSASTSATNAASSASAASSSASAASTSATDAATSATNAANSATAAATSATNASNSATAAASSASSASSSASTATTQASNASTSATNAASSATSAASSASTATTQAGLASTSATNAANSASAASTSATNASNSASAASTSASNAATSATNAASSATSAASSASSAQSASDAALAALDSFDDRYLGQKSSAPTVDNDGNALVTGALYFDTVSNAMKVWDGTQWLSAYASLSGALLATNNLSDLTSTSTARTNLGVAIGTDVQAYDADTAKLDVSQSWSAAQAFNAGVTLGDASGDALTINSSAVSIPNGLNFDSNTFVIDATNNNVGIGTASPASFNSAADNLVVGTTSGTNGITIAAGSAAQASIFFADGTATGAEQAAGYLYYYHPTDSMVLGTNNTERMRITSTGNVGIGTSSPSQKLQVAGTISIAGRGSSYGLLYPDWILYNSSSGGAFVFDNGSERMRIDSSGNLGLGVTPSAWSTSFPAFQVGYTGAVSGRSGTTEAVVLSSNYYNNAGAKYIGTGYATRYEQYSGAHYWSTAASGTAGNAITFTQAMTLDASGRLGIGTSSPGGILHTVQTSAGAATTGAILQNADNSLSSEVRLLFAPNLSTNWGNRQAYISGINMAAGGTATALAFGTAANGAAPTEKMRIDTSGNLGLGVTPSAWDATGKAIQLSNAGQAIYAGSTGFSTSNHLWISNNGYFNGTNWVYSRTNPAAQIQLSNGECRFFNAASGTAGNTITFTQAMTLDASGNFAIGSSSPGARLEVTGGAKATTGIMAYINSNSSGANCKIHYTDGATYNWTAGTTGNNFTWSTGEYGTTAGTERMRIDSSGNVGIGTTSPGYKLDIYGASLPEMRIRDATVTFQTYTDGSSAAVLGTVGSHALVMRTNAVERMRITSSGNLLVGTSTNPSSGNVRQVLANSGDTYLQIASGSTGGGLIGQTGATMLFYTYTGAVGSESYTERMRIDSSGNLKFNSGYGSVATAYGCRAWVNFAGSNGSIRASGNVSSVTRNGTGYYTVNFSSAMPDTSYTMAGAGKIDSGNADNNSVMVGFRRVSGGIATGSSAVSCTSYTNNALDPETVTLMFVR